MPQKPAQRHTRFNSAERMATCPCRTRAGALGDGRPQPGHRTGDNDGLPRRAAQAHQAVADHRGDGQGARAESGGPRRHRSRRRRAGFRHARQHQAGGDQGDPGRQGVEIHAGRRARRAEGSGGAQVQARERPRLQDLADHGRRRRQAGALQRVHGDAQSRRRGDHPGAVLGELSRHGAARRRHAGAGRRHHGERLQDQRRRRSSARSRRRPSGSCSTRRRTRPAPPIRAPS